MRWQHAVDPRRAGRVHDAGWQRVDDARRAELTALGSDLQRIEETVAARRGVAVDGLRNRQRMRREQRQVPEQTEHLGERDRVRDKREPAGDGEHLLVELTERRVVQQPARVGADRHLDAAVAVAWRGDVEFVLRRLHQRPQLALREDEAVRAVGAGGERVAVCGIRREPAGRDTDQEVERRSEDRGRCG